MPVDTDSEADKNGRGAGKSPHGKWKGLIAGAGAGVVLLAAAARLGAGQHWLAGLMGNLSAQVALVAGLVSGWWIIRKKWGLAAVGTVALAMSLAGVWTPRARWGAADSAGRVRVMVYNAYSYSRAPAAAYRSIMNSGADIVALSEPTPALLDLLRSPEARAVYPYAFLPEAARGGWRVMFSRWPQRWEGPGAEGWEGSRGLALAGATWITIVERPEGPFAFVHLHPISPRTRVRWHEGNATLELALQAIEEQVVPLGIPVVMGGDLNSTPSGWRSREIDRRGILRRCKPLALAEGTFPAGLLWPLSLAIDDVWVSEAIKVTRWRRGERGGSDHHPVIVDLAVP
jgi:endonuclease/exonuclease/phosphatase (EEP) superfamily protein YafD